MIRLEDRVNAQAALRLFDERQEAQPLRKLHMVADNACYYRYQAVSEYPQKKPCRIRLHLLPTYLPNLNLIKRFWGFLKREVIYNCYYEKFEYLKMAVMNFFWSINVHDPAIRSLMTDNFGIMKSEDSRAVDMSSNTGLQRLNLSGYIIFSLLVAGLFIFLFIAVLV